MSLEILSIYFSIFCKLEFAYWVSLNFSLYIFICVEFQFHVGKCDFEIFICCLCGDYNKTLDSTFFIFEFFCLWVCFIWVYDHVGQVNLNFIFEFSKIIPVDLVALNFEIIFFFLSENLCRMNNGIVKFSFVASVCMRIYSKLHF